MALAGDTGLSLDADGTLAADAWFFGEDQGRYLLACTPETADALIAEADAARVPARAIGRTGGAAVALGKASTPLSTLRAAHEHGFARIMGEDAVHTDAMGETGNLA